MNIACIASCNCRSVKPLNCFGGVGLSVIVNHPTLILSIGIPGSLEGLNLDLLSIPTQTFVRSSRLGPIGLRCQITSPLLGHQTAYYGPDRELTDATHFFAGAGLGYLSAPTASLACSPYLPLLAKPGNRHPVLCVDLLDGSNTACRYSTCPASVGYPPF